MGSLDIIFALIVVLVVTREYLFVFGQDASADDSATNFALGKFPAQSSTVTGYPVYKSVDGKAYTCSMTEEFASIKYPQYWRVDMGGQVYVTGVTIVTMADKLDERLGNFEIEVGDSPYPERNHRLCYKEEGTLGMYVDQRFNCPGPMLGNWVTISKRRTPESGHIKLCEVKVHGFEAASRIKNVELHKGIMIVELQLNERLDGGCELVPCRFSVKFADVTNPHAMVVRDRFTTMIGQPITFVEKFDATHKYTIVVCRVDSKGWVVRQNLPVQNLDFSERYQILPSCESRHVAAAWLEKLEKWPKLD